MTSVTMYLKDGREIPWLRSRGITDTTSSALAPLTDAGSAALCARMDSTLSIRPTYYFRAGSYVIASIARPLRLSGKTLGGLGANIFVFDSTGRWVNSQGEYPVITPTDVHVTSNTGGRVMLRWTNLASDITSLQLQRASGAGPFTPIGLPLSPATSTATDSTALPDSVYTYRLMASTARKKGESNDVRVVTSSDVSVLTRTATGLVFQDSFDRPDESLVGSTKNWDRVATSGGSDADLNVVGNLARYTGNDDNMPEAKHTPETGPILVQTDWKRVSGGRTGIALFDATTGARSVFALRDPYHGWELWYHGGTSWSNILNNGGSLADSTRLTLLRENNRVRMWAGGTLIFDWGTNAMNGVGLRGGMYMIQPTDWDNFVVCRGNTITVRDLPNGYRFRVAGVMSDPSFGGTPLSIELAGAAFPQPQLEVLDGTNTLVRAHTPTGGMCGGDVFSLSLP